MNNEEKILQLLEKQGKILEKHGEMLEKHGEMLEKHGEMLENLGKEVAETRQLAERTAVLLETDYADKLQLLFDGHELIKEKLDGLAPRSRVDDLETDVAMLKDVIKLMRMEITELKKAQ